MNTPETEVSKPNILIVATAIRRALSLKIKKE